MFLDRKYWIFRIFKEKKFNHQTDFSIKFDKVFVPKVYIKSSFKITQFSNFHTIWGRFSQKSGNFPTFEFSTPRNLKFASQIFENRDVETHQNFHCFSKIKFPEKNENQEKSIIFECWMHKKEEKFIDHH
jgi:hypothetical protein